jgi:hypothetical protein
MKARMMFGAVIVPFYQLWFAVWLGERIYARMSGEVLSPPPVVLLIAHGVATLLTAMFVLLYLRALWKLHERSVSSRLTWSIALLGAPFLAMPICLHMLKKEKVGPWSTENQKA